MRCIGSADGCEEALTAGVCSFPCLVGFWNAPRRIVLLSSYLQVYVTHVLQRQDASIAVFESLFAL